RPPVPRDVPSDPRHQDHPRLPTLAGCRLARGPPPPPRARGRRGAGPPPPRRTRGEGSGRSLPDQPRPDVSACRSGKHLQGAPLAPRGTWVTTDIAASLWIQDLGAARAPRPGRPHPAAVPTA